MGAVYGVFFFPFVADLYFGAFRLVDGSGVDVVGVSVVVPVAGHGGGPVIV